MKFPTGAIIEPKPIDIEHDAYYLIGQARALDSMAHNEHVSPETQIEARQEAFEKRKRAREMINGL